MTYNRFHCGRQNMRGRKCNLFNSRKYLMCILISDLGALLRYVENVLSWYIRSQVMSYIADRTKEDFLGILKSWLENPTRGDFVKVFT